MNKALFLLWVASLAWTLAGCGGTSSGTAETTATPTAAHATTGEAAAQTSAVGRSQQPVVLPVTETSSPQEVVLAFLNGMRDGNSGVTAALLTAKAQEETVKHNWPVQPPGAPTATYKLGDSLFLDQQQTAVQVPCIWAEGGETNEKIEFQVVWVLRRQTDGWRVAGFASEVVPGQPEYFFNFEDIAQLKAEQAKAEQALVQLMDSQSADQAVAENPSAPTTLR